MSFFPFMVDADVDECAIGRDLCDQVCINTVGSYSCACNDGYELAANKRKCRGQLQYMYYLLPSICLLCVHNFRDAAHVSVNVSVFQFVCLSVCLSVCLQLSDRVLIKSMAAARFVWMWEEEGITVTVHQVTSSHRTTPHAQVGKQCFSGKTMEVFERVL